jgi:hypothetical protein
MRGEVEWMIISIEAQWKERRQNLKIKKTEMVELK